MTRRRLRRLLHQRLAAYPAVALLGARQVGKTTLARSLSGVYFDLEQPQDRLRIDVEWDAVAAGRKLVILDEVQNAPELFARLRGAIDQAPRRAGRFLLLGSVSPALLQASAESLAGRLALCELTPLTLREAGPRRARVLWLRGGYPAGGVMSASAYPAWQDNYLSLLAQRDLPNWGLTAAPRTTLTLFRMLAAGQGTVWNASEIGRSLGLSYHTVNSYLDQLEHAYLVRRLPPYHRNIRKRLVKSPKVYWRDSGLLHALLQVETHDDLLAQPWVGASWEGFVIEQVLAELGSSGRPHQAFYFRTQDGVEVDLVLELGRDLWAIEIKLTSAPSRADFDRLERAAALIDASRVCLISQTRTSSASGRRMSVNLRDFVERLPP